MMKKRKPKVPLYLVNQRDEWYSVLMLLIPDVEMG